MGGGAGGTGPRRQDRAIAPGAAPLAPLLAALSRGQIAAVEAGLEGFAQAPGKLAPVLPELVAAMLAAGQAERLLACLLAPDARLWHRLPLLARLGAVLCDTPAFAAFAALLRQRAERVGPMPFAEGDYLRQFDARVIPLLLALKYPRHDPPADLGAVFAMAAGIAAGIACNATALERLFERRRNRAQTRAGWEADLRLSLALEHLTGDFGLEAMVCREGVSPQAMQEIAKAAPPGLGRVMAFHHGGFAAMRFVLLERVLPEAIYITNHPSIARRLSIEADASGGSLIAAVRHLAKGGMVGISPDGATGADGPEIRVLGRGVTIKSGAGMLAYEGQARTSWLAMGRAGQEFRPLLREGPVRQRSERYGAFCDRFAAFYEDCLNEFFTGDPQNLVHNQRWSRFLTELEPLPGGGPEPFAKGGM